MKWLRWILICVVLVATACESPVNAVVETEDEAWKNDSRTTLVDAASYKWIRKPVTAKSFTAKAVVINIADGDPIATYCTEPGWSYLFFDDQAVIGYEPFPENMSVMQAAVSITVELHNRDNPDALWGYINVPPIADPPPVTSNDPVLGKWQVCFCLDDGTIVWGPLTAEFDFNWAAWKAGTVALDLELYNRDHDPDAHVVWGTDE